MSNPVCPKCKGRLVRVPDKECIFPTIKCTVCGWFVEQTPPPYMDCERKPASAAVLEGSRRGGLKAKEISKIDVEVSRVPDKVYVSVKDGEYIHLFKADYAGKGAKNAKSYCGVVGVKTTGTDNLTVCKTCFRNYETRKADDAAKSKAGKAKSRGHSSSKGKRT